MKKIGNSSTKMKKNYFIFLFIVNFSFSQAIKQDKSIRATMVYGYFLGMEHSLEKIFELKPNFRSRINNINLLYKTNFIQSKKNAFQYIRKIENLEEKIKPSIDSVKNVIEENIIFITEKEIENYKNYIFLNNIFD